MDPSEPLLATALADDLATNRAAEGERPTADHTLLRCSDAYRCSRQMAFGALKVPRAIELDTTALMAFDAGRHHHARLQGLLASKFGAELEVPVSYKDSGIDLSGHADAVYDHEGRRRCVEIKSMKAYPFLKAAGGTDRFGRHVEPEGPKVEHVVQCGLYGYAPQIRADELHLCYLCKEDGAIAEFIIPMKGEPVGPHGEDVLTLVLAELGRLKQIADDIGKGMLPWRRIPGWGVIKAPPAADSKADPWNCRYCGWQPICAGLPASKVAVATVRYEAESAGIRRNGTPVEEEPF
jgi:hypothetical protein